MRSPWMLLAFSLMYSTWIPTAFSSESEPPSTPPFCKALFQRIQLVPANTQNDPMERLKKLSSSTVELELLNDLPHAADLIKKRFHSSRLNLISHNQETSDQAFFHLLESRLHKSEAFYQFQLVVVPSAVEAARVQKNFQLFFESDRTQIRHNIFIAFHRFDMQMGYTALQENLISTTRKAMLTQTQNVFVATYEDIRQLADHQFAANISPKFESVFVLRTELLTQTKSAIPHRIQTMKVLSRLEENINHSQGQIYHFETVLEPASYQPGRWTTDALNTYQYWTFVDDYSRFSHFLLNQVPMVDFVTSTIHDNSVLEMELHFIQTALALRRFHVLYGKMEPHEKNGLAEFLAKQVRVYQNMPEFKQMLQLSDDQLVKLYRDFFKP
jgi:hypothetical protein